MPKFSLELSCPGQEQWSKISGRLAIVTSTIATLAIDLNSLQLTLKSIEPMLNLNLDPYQLAIGGERDLATLVKFLQLTYGEIFPERQEFQHLQATVDRHFSAETPLWFVVTEDRHNIACLWLGIAIDQINGLRHPNIFLIYVDPRYRRQGIATALMDCAHSWASARSYSQIGLQVFTSNQPAIDLYQRLGYQPRSISMIREIPHSE
jgi:GNAT superfamily N-acetyltransferase